MTRTVRSFLDGLYFVSGVLAALCLVAILVLIVIQMVARWTGEVFPGAPNYAGYAMAAASFLAFAHALNRGAHIRVSLVLNLAGPRGERILNTWCFALGAVLAWTFVYYAVRMVYWSWRLNDVSQGPDATPLFIPQAVMLFGAFVFALALTDNALALMTDGRDRVRHTIVDQAHGE